MGWVNFELVPAAILYLNPNGLTREQFIEELSKVKVGPEPHGKYPLTDEGGGYPRTGDNVFSQGLYGLANLLSINKDDFLFEKDFNPVTDNLHARIFSRATFQQALEPGFVVKHLKREYYGEELEIEACDYGFKFERGKQYIFPGLPREKDFFGNIEIISSKKSGEKINPPGIRGRVPYIKIRGKKVYREFETEVFMDADSMTEKYPPLSPEKNANWDQREGSFRTRKRYSEGKVVDGKVEYVGKNMNPPWVKKGDRYSLKDMLQYPEKEWTSIALTAEVIKAQAWSVLAWHGYEHTQRFLTEFPEARQNHGRAVLWYNLSHLAKEKGWNTTELLREFSQCYSKLKPGLEEISFSEWFKEGRNDWRYGAIGTPSAHLVFDSLAEQIRNPPGEISYFTYPFSEDIEEKFDKTDEDPFGNNSKSFRCTPYEKIHSIYESLQKPIGKFKLA